MESAEAFLLRFFDGRNALFRRNHQELDAYQKQFCQGALIYDKRLSCYEEERILDVIHDGGKAKITTTGNIKGKNAGRLLYELSMVDGEWLISDFMFECPICRGSKFTCAGSACVVLGRGEAPSDTCRVCKGLGWISTLGEVDRLLDG